MRVWLRKLFSYSNHLAGGPQSLWYVNEPTSPGQLTGSLLANSCVGTCDDHCLPRNLGFRWTRAPRDIISLNEKNLKVTFNISL